MAKDAKGHGSNGRGRVGFDVDPKTGPTPAQKAVAASVMYGSRDPRTIAAMHGIPTGQLGAFKVQSLNTKLAGAPWGTVKRYGNRAVAERVAQYMRGDGGFTRVR